MLHCVIVLLVQLVASKKIAGKHSGVLLYLQGLFSDASNFSS